MEYRLKIGEQDLNLDIETDEENRFTAVMGEDRCRVGFRRISDHQIHLTVDGRSVTAFAADTPDGKAVMIQGQTWLVADADAQNHGGRKRGGPQSGPTEVTPPMPAVVTRILVKEGQDVIKGQGVVVVSAMKMETTLNAPYDGRVSRINVAEGDKVAPKQILVDLEATDSK